MLAAFAFRPVGPEPFPPVPAEPLNVIVLHFHPHAAPFSTSALQLHFLHPLFCPKNDHPCNVVFKGQNVSIKITEREKYVESYTQLIAH